MRTPDFDFEAHIARLRAKTAAQIAAVGDVGDGAILRHHSSERWAFLLPDCSGSGWRMQTFDRDGFSGHALYAGPEAAVRAAVGQGYLQRDDGALDRVSGLYSFHRGNFASDLIRRVSQREISFEQGDALLKEYEDAHADPLTAG